jgi:hypothetical protein
MKLVVAAYLLATSVGVAKAQTCVEGKWHLKVTGECNFDTILAAYQQQVFDVTGATSCTDGTVTAAEELNALLTSLNQDVDSICSDLYANMDKTEFYEAAAKGTDFEFEKAYYNGYTSWVEEVETTYESDDGSVTSRLRVDAAPVNAFYQGKGSYSQVNMPPIENFETCSSNAAMCCWTADRQARDNNGNCNTNTYSENCVDKDPADNTNLCSVDLAKGGYASGFNSPGIVEFPGDGDNGEGSIHCHGYAWANDDMDTITRYRANNLFYVSLYDHMHQRGYVENVPGAPMCGCVEKMPIATRSDCTQVDVTEDYSVVYDGNSVVATMDKVEVDFNACQGKNNRNNDLYAYVYRLYEEGKVNRHQFGAVGRTLTDDSRCEYAREAELAKKGLQYGFQYNQSNWTQVAGNGGMDTGRAAFGANAFKAAWEQSDNNIVHRACGDCESPDHKHIFYRRFTAVPEDFDLLNHLMNGKSNANGNNVFGEDFQLYSTYEDAVNDVNRWKCNNGFNYGAVFDGECSPSGARTRNQWLKFSDTHGSPVRSVGLYLDKPSGHGATTFRSVGAWTEGAIGQPIEEGGTIESDGVYHMSCGGKDIWGRDDQGHMKYRHDSGDIEIKVHVEGIVPITNSWAKAGVMIRSSLEDDTTTAFGLLSGENGVAMHARTSKGNYMTMPGGNFDTNQKDSWVKLVKIGSTVSFYYSSDGVTWTLHTSETIFFPEDRFIAGLACTSHNEGKATEATFSNFEITRYAAPTASPTVSSAPTAWDADKNIGEPIYDGAYWEDAGNGSSKVRGGGSGIWGTSDSFFFHSFQRENNDFVMTAYVSGFGSGYAFAKGGLMIRDGSTANASNVFIGAMGAYKGIGFQSRQSTGAETVHHGTHWVSSNKAWIKLIKIEDSIEALYRAEEDEEWTSLGTKSVSFTGLIEVGYAVTVGNEEKSWNYADLYVKDYSITDIE